MSSQFGLAQPLEGPENCIFVSFSLSKLFFGGGRGSHAHKQKNVLGIKLLEYRPHGHPPASEEEPSETSPQTMASRPLLAEGGGCRGVLSGQDARATEQHLSLSPHLPPSTPHPFPTRKPARGESVKQNRHCFQALLSGKTTGFSTLEAS